MAIVLVEQYFETAVTSWTLSYTARNRRDRPTEEINENPVRSYLMI
jgi:hypothetical protein